MSNESLINRLGFIALTVTLLLSTSANVNAADTKAHIQICKEAITGKLTAARRHQATTVHFKRIQGSVRQKLTFTLRLQDTRSTVQCRIRHRKIERIDWTKAARWLDATETVSASP